MARTSQRHFLHAVNKITEFCFSFWGKMWSSSWSTGAFSSRTTPFVKGTWVSNCILVTKGSEFGRENWIVDKTNCNSLNRIVYPCRFHMQIHQYTRCRFWKGYLKSRVDRSGFRCCEEVLRRGEVKETAKCGETLSYLKHILAE